jgi:lysozyme
VNTPARQPLQPKKGPTVVFTAVAVSLLALLVPSEGGQRLKPYKDPIGIPTACTGIIGPEVTRRYLAGEVFTKTECDKMDTNYAVTMLRKMNHCVAGNVAGMMNAQQVRAYAHWAYNVGTHAFCNSTVKKKLEAQDWEGSCRAMGAWTFVTMNNKKINCRYAGKLCPGIVKRRDYEVNMCLDALE